MKLFGKKKRLQRAKSNFAFNKPLDSSDGLINGQSVTPNVSKMKYGKYTVSFNGCGVIAVYNALMLYGFSTSLAQLIFEFENSGFVSLRGFFGTRPRAVGKFLSRLGVRFRTTLFKRTTEKAAKDGDILILTFWNHRFNPFKGLHTVTVKCDKGKYIVYNMYSNRHAVYRYDSLSQLLGKGKLMLSYKLEGLMPEKQ